MRLNFAEPFHAAALRFGLLLASVDRVAGAADFDLLRFDRARNQVDRLAGRAGGLRILEHLGVDGGLHSWRTVHEFWATAREASVTTHCTSGHVGIVNILFLWYYMFCNAHTQTAYFKTSNKN